MARNDPNDTSIPIDDTGNVRLVDLTVINRALQSLTNRLDIIEARMKVVCDELVKMDKAIDKASKHQSLDPIRRYGRNEKLDYSDWADDEDCLASTARFPDVDKYNNW